MGDTGCHLLEDFLDKLLDEYSDTSSDEMMLDPLEMDFTQLLQQDSLSSRETQSASNMQLSEATSLADVPTNTQEWQVVDNHSQRLRPPRLLEFLLLLLAKKHYQSYACYTKRSEGVFQIYQPEKVAKLWEEVKNRHSQQSMTYDKFARAIRWFYKSDLMIKTNTRYTFQFSPRVLRVNIVDANNNTTTSASCAD